MKRKQRSQPDDFPIEDYDELLVSEIEPLLSELYDEELKQVRDWEASGANRQMIIYKIDVLLGDVAELPDEDEEDEEDVLPEITHQFCIQQAAQALLQHGETDLADSWSLLAREVREADAAAAAAFEAIQKQLSNGVKSG